jgi:hypothetical protein
MPRRRELNEHRNDHQVATAKRFAQQGRIGVAFNEHQLAQKLDQLEAFHGTERLGAQASPRLIAAIRAFLETGRTTALETRPTLERVGKADEHGTQ